MTERSPTGRAAVRVFWLLLAAIAVPALFWLWPSFSRSGDAASALPRSEKHLGYVLLDEKLYLAADRTGDGQVDCLTPVGVRGVIGSGVYAAEGYTGRCARRMGSRVMDAELRDTLTQMVAKKFALETGHTSCVDLDRDGAVDCVVNVHNTEIVVLAAHGATCASAARAELTEAQRKDYSSILALEEIVRRRLREDA